MSALRDRITRELEHALDDFEVVAAVEIASHGDSGWEPESAAALVRIAVRVVLHLSSAIDKRAGDPEVLLMERIEYYQRLADETESLLHKYRELSVQVVRDPTIMSGDPTIRGTRVPAETILAYLRAGHTHEEIHQDYPSLPPGAVEAVLRWDRERQRKNGIMQQLYDELDALDRGAVAEYEQLIARLEIDRGGAPAVS